MNHVKIGDLQFGNDLPLGLIAGPCQMESRQHALETAHALKEIGERLNVGIIYKTSFDKANRTSASAARAGGGLRVFGISGLQGSGKSTLLRILAGDDVPVSTVVPSHLVRRASA